ncbi:alpha/beta fold hydrolase [Psychrosphaera ytuae]|uniref:Proline iminopeptidase n=1 Tax=Psychrosphaera ytuae TaxID=2820710 RepID=A0A975DFN3_9GAMM|nr:alpha/beta fold hydrolase [Psychrosphaera ytuae]QTH64780.1 alpha/beta fold hydrolase [Psychrosphaera ytuae]
MLSVLTRLSGIAMLSGTLISPSVQAQQLELEKCFVDGIKSQVLCGSLEVPENRAEPISEQNKIDVNVVVLPKFKEESKTVPVIFLAGGPGQAATELAGMMDGRLEKVRREHDIIFVDQRGTGKSNAIMCDKPFVEPLSFDDSQLDVKAEIEACLADNTGHHLPSYNSIEHIKDLEAVRAALGHEQLHVFGGSYGTRAGFTYLQQFPESVKTAVLDSNAPMQLVIGFFGKTSERAFDMLVEDCKNTESCHKAFPNLKQDYLDFAERLKKGPIKVDMFHPLTGKPVEFVMTDSKVIESLRGLLYSLGTRSMLPYAINRAASGDYRMIAALIGQQADSERQPGQLYNGLTLNILCNEDIPRAMPSDIKKDGDNYFNGNNTFEQFSSACEHWPKFEVESGFNEPLKTDVPVLLFSGLYDPVTPPEYGDMAMETLENAKHVVIKQASHVASFNQCIDPISEFVKTGSFDGLDFSCADQERQRMFFVDMNQIK